MKRNGQLILKNLLVGKRSDPPKPKNIVRSIFEEKRTTHSKKPKCVRKWIEESFPDCPKIELFARHKYEGWDTWGMEIAAYEFTNFLFTKYFS